MIFFFYVFLLIKFWRWYVYIIFQVRLHHFSKIKIIKKSQNRRNQCFSYFFCLMIEGSGSGSVSLTNGSGSGRPKNIWILRIRIRNTGYLLPLCYRCGEPATWLSCWRRAPWRTGAGRSGRSGLSGSTDPFRQPSAIPGTSCQHSEVQPVLTNHRKPALR